MRFTEVGVSRALRVYSAIATAIGVDGPKSDKPIEKDRVYQHWQGLERQRMMCVNRCCASATFEVNRSLEVRQRDDESTRILVAIGNLCRDAGFGDDHVLECVRRMADAAKSRGEHAE